VLPDHERLWNKRELAQYLRVSIRSLERLDIPRIALTGRGATRPIVRYDPAEVKAWIEKKKSRTLLRKNA
jgi:hypothetical protein